MLEKSIIFVVNKGRRKVEEGRRRVFLLRIVADISDKRGMENCLVGVRNGIVAIAVGEEHLWLENCTWTPQPCASKLKGLELVKNHIHHSMRLLFSLAVHKFPAKKEPTLEDDRYINGCLIFFAPLFIPLYEMWSLRKTGR